MTRSLPRLAAALAVAVTLAVSLAASTAGCGPGPTLPIDAALFFDSARPEAGPPDAAVIDADLEDRPMRDGGPVIACTDTLEPNDVRENAQDLLSGDIRVDRVGICTDRDVDWYSTEPLTVSTISFQIVFTHYDGDLVLDLLDSTGALLQRSDNSSFAMGEESLLLPGAAAGGKYFIRVSAKRADDRVPYVLTVDYR